MQTCGIKFESGDVIRLGHGSGGRLTERLVKDIFLPALGNPVLNELDDAAILNFGNAKLAVSIDSYVVKPLFFPGGDIGSLAVHGTMNDLAMRTARPLYLTASFILEEGFSLDCLAKVVASLQQAALSAGVDVVAADTKVVDRGAGDGVYINTCGLGIVTMENPPSGKSACPGDRIIINGDPGRHGIAILCQREELELEVDLESDSALLYPQVEQMIASGAPIHTMRDLTRGGLSSALNEIATACHVGIDLDESLIPLHPSVKAACELLGLDPLYVACEGRFITIAPEESIARLLEAGRACQKDYRVIGTVVDQHKTQVVIKSQIGGRRVLDKLSGDQLPRIC